MNELFSGSPNPFRKRSETGARPLFLEHDSILRSTITSLVSSFRVVLANPLTTEEILHEVLKEQRRSHRKPSWIRTSRH